MNNYPVFRPAKIAKALTQVYRLLRRPMPPVMVARDLYRGYDLARGDAPGVAMDACRNVVQDSQWGESLSVIDDTVWTLCWQDTQETNREKFGRVIRAAADVRRDISLDPQTQFVGQSRHFEEAYASARFQATGRHAGSSSSRVVSPRIELQQIPEYLGQAHENGLQFYFPLNTKLILVPMPRVAADSDNRLHSVDKPALAWRDGAQFCFLHGVWFSESLWKKVCNRELSFAEVLTLENIEQRRAALRIYSIDEIVKHAGKLLEKKRGYELYSVRDIFRNRAYFLKYTCPSTGREYVSGIDPGVGRFCTVSLALQWKFRLEGCDVDDVLFTEES